MRRFYLFRRNQNNKIYNAQIINPLTGKKMIARSTGCSDKDEAHFTVMTWLKNGEISDGPNQEKRKLDEVYAVDDLLSKLKTLSLTGADTDKIINILKERDLISNVRTKN